MRCHCGHESKHPIKAYPWHCLCGAVWLSETEKRRGPCKHLGEQTGEFVACRTCGNGTVMLPIHRCQIHGVTLQRKPVTKAGSKPWDGVNCVTCEQRE